MLPSMNGMNGTYKQSNRQLGSLWSEIYSSQLGSVATSVTIHGICACIDDNYGQYSWVYAYKNGKQLTFAYVAYLAAANRSTNIHPGAQLNKSGVTYKWLYIY